MKVARAFTPIRQPCPPLRDFVWSTLACLILCANAFAQPLSDQKIAALTFKQNLNTQVSLELPFVDEEGQQVQLRQYFGRKPVILVLGYYECPMLCTFVLNGMVESLEDLKWSIGNEFDVINVSINPKEKPLLAAAKKRTYLKRYGRTGAAAGWHFLTGDETSIEKLATEAGFQYAYDSTSGQFAHPSGLVFLTPDGRIASYRMGVTFRPTDLLNSLQQAESGRAGSPVQKLILLCFHYNPISGKYGPMVMMIVRGLALLTIAGIGWLVFSLVRHEQLKRSSRAPAKEIPQPSAGP